MPETLACNGVPRPVGQSRNRVPHGGKAYRWNKPDLEPVAVLGLLFKLLESRDYFCQLPF